MTDKCVVYKYMELFLPRNGDVTFPSLLFTRCKSCLTRSVLQTKFLATRWEISHYFQKSLITFQKSLQKSLVTHSKSLLWHLAKITRYWLHMKLHFTAVLTPISLDDMKKKGNMKLMIIFRKA